MGPPVCSFCLLVSFPCFVVLRKPPPPVQAKRSPEGWTEQSPEGAWFRLPRAARSVRERPRERSREVARERRKGGGGGREQKGIHLGEKKIANRRERFAKRKKGTPHRKAQPTQRPSVLQLKHTKKDTHATLGSAGWARRDRTKRHKNGTKKVIRKQVWQLRGRLPRFSYLFPLPSHVP